MSAIRILVTGSRDWPLSRKSEVWIALDDAYRRAMNDRGILTFDKVDVTLVFGACPRGVDAIAEAFAIERGWTGEPHPADWDACGPDCPTKPHRIRRRPGDVDHPGVLDTYCPKAGPRRNALMVSLGADRAVALPLGKGWSGTRGCAALAQKAGIPTVVHEGEVDP